MKATIPKIDINANVRKFLGIPRTGSIAGVQGDERNASFDYCFNYFQSFRERGKLAELTNADNLQMSCLQLGFYLANWGMFRNSFLLDKSVSVYGPVIDIIAAANPALWAIDADRYTPANVEQLLQCKASIVKALDRSNKPSDNLVSKIILGTFGSVPAFDKYFTKGLGSSGFGAKALRKIAEFYAANTLAINSFRIPTIDFTTGQPTQRVYPKAKILDMVFHIRGLHLLEK